MSECMFRPAWDYRRSQREHLRAQRRLQKQRMKYHPDNDTIKYHLEQEPCPACGNLTVRYEKVSRAWGRRRKKWDYRADYVATCGTCKARGMWPVTGVSVSFILGAIRRQMKLALAKELMKP